MKRRPAAFAYVLLGVVLTLWMNLPKSSADALRSWTVGFLAPAWRGVEKLKTDDEKSLAEKREFHRLQLENQHLKAKLETACEWLSWERAHKERANLFEKKQTFMKSLLDFECSAIPAAVIYRDPSSWSSSLWVRVGEEDNRLLGKCIVAKNSPVVYGLNLIGVIDFVGKHQSRVRLITDSGVVPAVRGVRGGAQNREIASLCQAISHRLQLRDDLKREFQKLIEALGQMKEDYYLAKGELHGSSAPFWRSRSLFLKGIGFNYEFSDSHGEARDLRGGETPLLKAGDLLITSGLDGVFPEGLIVGHVTSVEPLKEGAYSYDLIARPAISHVYEIKTVFVLPPS